MTVYTTDAKDADERIGGYDNPETQNEVEVFRFRNVSNSLAWKNIQVPPRMLSSLLIEVGKFDVVHTHEFRSPPTVFAHLAAEVRDVPHVHQPRGSVPRFELANLKKVFDSVLGKRILSEVDHIIASSNTEASKYPDMFSDVDFKKVRHVPNGISETEYQNIPGQGQFRTEYNIDEDEPLVLFLSRLHPRKGGDLLIDAVSDISDESVRLAFVGPNEGARDKWKARAARQGLSDRSLFTGPLYGSDKLSAYADADAFVLPSKNKYESFGNVVLEAMACGTPAVCTDVCGVAEWIDHDACAVVPPRSDALLEGIQDVLSSDSYSLQGYVRDNFSWSSVASMTEAVYKESRTSTEAN